MSASRAWVAFGLLLISCEVGEQWVTAHAHRDGGDSGRANRPPELVQVFVAPLETDVGASIALSVTAEDPDGDPVTLHWSGTGGRIKEPHSADTTYTCKEAGHHAVAITARDAGGLVAASTIDVMCR